MSNAGQPPEKPTVELDKPPAWAISLSEKVSHGFAEVKADISLVANDVSIAKDRIGVVETRVKQLEDRSDTNSIRAKGASEVDLKHEAVIANLVVKATGLEETQAAQTAKLADIEKKTDVQTAMLTKAFSLTKDPRVVAVVAFAYFWLRSYAAKHGVELP